ncbi:hypothetical protein [Mesorhizobium sp. M1322]|uniref:hypothetical protein n=1 Tax=Mesorhizobium sp. M1322 TaxID=2957081 RepID=UPI00333DFDAE
MTDPRETATPESHPLQGYWDRLGGRGGRIEALLSELAKIPGMVLGVDRMTRLGVALAALADRGAYFRNAADAADVMMPLLTINGEAQLAGRAAIAAFWGRVEVGPRQSDKKALKMPWQKRFNEARLRIWLAAVLTTVMVLGVGYVVFAVPHAAVEITPTPPTIPQPGPSQATFWPWLAELFMRDILHRLFAVLVVACFAALWWSYVSNRREERLARDRKDGLVAATMTPEASEILFPTAVVRRAGRLLRRPVRVAGHRLDVRRSVEASIEAFGYPTLEMGLESRAPDCLMLVERIGRDDHLPALADALAKRLRDGGADLLRYEFRIFPDVLEAVGRRFGGQPVVSLAALARRHPGARVVIVGTGRGFFEPYELNKLRLGKPFFGEPEELPWVDHQVADRQQRQAPRALPAFREPPILMTPSPPDRWGPAERALQQAGFAVISLGSAENSNAGLESAVEAVVGNRRPQAVDRGVMAHATPNYDPLLLELDRAEFASDIPPPDNAFRERLARRVTAYACARIGEAEEDEFDPPDDPYQPDDFVLRAGAALAALALFPKLDPQFTPALWKHVTGHALSAARLARLARLPWFRAGRMPDWFRSDLARCFQRETEQQPGRWKTLRTELAVFANLCLVRSPDAFGLEVHRPSTSLEKLLSQMRVLRSDADPASRALVEERLFLTFLESGEVADTELAVHLPAPERLTPAMRLSLLGFGVAALVAAAFAPWALRVAYSWAGAIFDLSRSGDENAISYLMALCLPGAAIGIYVSLEYIYNIRMNRSGLRWVVICLLSVILAVITYAIEYIVVSSIAPYGSSEYESVVFFVVYSAIPAIVVASIILISPINKNHLTEYFSKYYPIVVSTSIAVSFSLMPVSIDRSFDSFYVFSSGLLASIGLSLCATKNVEKVKILVYTLCVIWQCYIAFEIVEVVISEFISSTYIDLVQTSFYTFSCSLLADLQFSDGWRRKLERITFIFGSSVSALLVSFLYYRTFASTPAIAYLGLGTIAGAIVWFWLLRNPRLEIRLGAYFLRFLKPVSAGSFRPVWIGILLKAILSGAVVAFLTNAVVGLIVLSLGSNEETVLQETLPRLPGLVSQSSPQLLAQIAAVVSLFLASYVLCRLTMRIYPASTVSGGDFAEKRRRSTEGPWYAAPLWVTLALWAIAILPASLHNWLSTANLLNIGALSKLGAEGFSAIDSLNGALIWALQVLFWLGGSTWTSLAYLALPVALCLGLRMGHAADRPILIGLLPFLLAVTILPASTPGGVWMVPLVVLLLRLARDPASGLRLLRFGGGFGRRPANPFVVFTLVLALALVLSPALIGRPGSNDVMMAIVPDVARAAVFVLIGAMRLSRLPVLAALGLILAISALPFGRLNFGLADTGINITVGFTPGQAVDLALSFAAVPLNKLLLRVRTDSPLWAVSMIVLGLVIVAAVVLSFGDGGVSVGTFVQLPTGELYRPTRTTLAILALTIGLAIQAQRRAFFYLVVLGSIFAAIALLGSIYGYLAAGNFWTGGVFVTQPEALTSPVANLIASLPSLVIAAGFMLLGRAAAEMLLGQAATGKPSGRATVDELPAYGNQPFFSTSSAAGHGSEAVLDRKTEAFSK